MEKYLEKIGIWLYEKLPEKIVKNDSVRQDLTTLDPAGNIPNLQRDFYVKKLSLCAMIVVIGLFLSMVLWIGNVRDAKIEDNTLVRNEYGEGENTYSLQVSDGDKEYDISLELSERDYTDEEINELSAKFIDILDGNILGDNESFDKIEYDMNFASKISGYPFSVEYSTDRSYISDEGKLVNRELDEPVITEIEMTVKYNQFEVIHTVNVMVYSKALKPTLIEQIEELLNKEESENRESSEFTLPDKVDNIDLTWNFKRSYTGLLCFMITPVIVILIYIVKDKDLHKLVEEREVQMRLDYPDIVSALALLVGAGMTVPNAWKKIAYDYRKRKENGGEIRYAYEEMLFTLYEMDSGVIQSAAYERFGRRCRIPCYNKLSTMVSQNIRKGAVNLPMLLKAEANEAFEDRKHIARKQGEQAGTRLLGPMMLLLIITMVVIMVPAAKTYF
jgi:hypothetical protein